MVASGRAATWSGRTNGTATQHDNLDEPKGSDDARKEFSTVGCILSGFNDTGRARVSSMDELTRSLKTRSNLAVYS